MSITELVLGMVLGIALLLIVLSTREARAWRKLTVELTQHMREMNTQLQEYLHWRKSGRP